MDAAQRSAERECCARTMLEIGRGEAMALLARMPFGRIVFTRDALPAIRPVNHLVDGQSIVVRTGATTGLAASVRARGSVVVAYEADEIDPVRGLGWSVVVTGCARPVTDPDLLAGYSARLRSWVDPAPDEVVAIEATLVHGVRLTAQPVIARGA
ncbi:pyridoxamine 5'-phosphate oxidase family protein [Nocardia farcinica]|nr:pyridoxamine 5'-phosphate oxidase family protein [Nocardia farcinica]